jgi:hypothetical protein
VNDPVIVALQILLAVAVAAIVLAPLVQLRGRRMWVEPEREAAIRSIAERKARLYGALLELDFDRDSGKISPEDHAKMKDETMAEVLAVLAEEERMGRTVPGRPTVVRGGDRVERMIEEYKRARQPKSEAGS